MSTNEKNSKKGGNKMSGRYINPYTDFGFKYLFGTEPNKENTLELVNALLQGREHIRSLTLIPTEQLGDTQDDRRSVFDVYCENEQGDKIIIEMQKADQPWFNPNRSLVPILFSNIKILCCPPKSQECLSLVHVSHET
jgi:hypothetical protein